MAGSYYTTRPTVGAANQFVSGLQGGMLTGQKFMDKYYDIRKKRRADELAGDRAGIGKDERSDADIQSDFTTPGGPDGQGGIVRPGVGQDIPTDNDGGVPSPPTVPVTQSALPDVSDAVRADPFPQGNPAADIRTRPGWNRTGSGVSPAAMNAGGTQAAQAVASMDPSKGLAIPAPSAAQAPGGVEQTPGAPASQAPNAQAAYAPGTLDPPGNALPEGYGAQPVDMNTAFSEGQATNGFLDRIRMVETNGDDGTPSRVGAMGPYQLMPNTIADPGFGVTPITPQEAMDPTRARQFASEYLNAMLRMFNGSSVLATSAYNAGPGQIMGVLNAGGSISDFPEETRNYVMKMFGTGQQVATAGMPTQQAPVQKPAGIPIQVAGGQYGGAVPHVMSYANGGYVEGAI